MLRFALILSLMVFTGSSLVHSQDAPTEADYYPITPFEIPEGVEPGETFEVHVAR